MAEWLERLQMGSKLTIEGGFIADIDLSQRAAQAGRPAAGAGRAARGDAVRRVGRGSGSQFRRIFYQLLLPRLKQMGKTVIAISHDDLYFLRPTGCWRCARAGSAS